MTQLDRIMLKLVASEMVNFELNFQNKILFLCKSEAYEFVIENASSKISADDLKREFTLHQELYKRHLDYVKNLVGNEFDLVSASYRMLNYLNG